MADEVVGKNPCCSRLDDCAGARQQLSSMRTDSKAPNSPEVIRASASSCALLLPCALTARGPSPAAPLEAAPRRGSSVKDLPPEAGPSRGDCRTPRIDRASRSAGRLRTFFSCSSTWQERGGGDAKEPGERNPVETYRAIARVLSKHSATHIRQSKI